MDISVNDPDKYRRYIFDLNDAMSFAESMTTFEINRAVLKSDRDERDIYLVTLRGTNRSFDKNDPLSVPTCLKAFLAKTNNYFETVKERMLSDIPHGSSVVMIGHSLGGMIAQQAAADPEIKTAFELIAVLGIGSPYVPISGRECPLRRFADRGDPVPWLGFSVKANLLTAKPSFAANGYFGKPVLAHTESYRQQPYWKRFDALGVPFGNNSIAVI